MQKPERYGDEVASFARARLNADLDKLLQSHGEPEQADPVEAALAASGALFAIAARTLVDALDVLTLPQYTTMTALSSGPASLGDLARHPDAVPGEVDNLLDAGWIRHSNARAGSRREPSVELTPHGAQLIAQINARRQAELTSVLEGLTPADRQALAKAFAVFAAAAGDTPEGSPP